MTFNCTPPSYGIPNYPPDTCNAIPVLTNAIKIIIETLCGLSFIGEQNEVRISPAGTADTDFNSYFISSVPSTTGAIMIEGNNLWQWNGAVWTQIPIDNTFRYATGIVPTPANLNALFINGTPFDYSIAIVDEQLWVTPDAGSNWTQVKPSHNFSISTTPADFIDIDNPTAGEINNLFPNGVSNDYALFWNGNNNRFYYTDDGGTNWYILSLNTIISDTLANILNFQTLGTLKAGVYYRVNDNIHAEGGDVLAIALDVDLLSNIGFYEHIGANVWFPMEWDTTNGVITKLTDPRYNNICIGQEAIDNFVWSYNESFPAGDFSNNIIENMQTFSWTSWTPSICIFTGNRFSNSTFSIDSGSFSTFSDCIIEQDSQVILDAASGTFIKNKIGKESIINFINTAATTTFRNNDFSNAFIDFDTFVNANTISNNKFNNVGYLSNILFNTITTSTMSNNNFENIASSNFQDVTNLTMENNSVISSSLILDTVVTDFSNNFITNSAVEFNNISSGDFSQNSILNSSVLAMPLVSNALGIVSYNNLTSNSLLTIYDVGGFQYNELNGANVTIEDSTNTLMEHNTFSNFGTFLLQQNTAASNIKYNIVNSQGDITIIGDLAGCDIENNIVTQQSSISITGCGNGDINFNNIHNGSSMIITSASFTGVVENNDVGIASILRFGAHTGTCSLNRIHGNSDITATKTSPNTCNSNAWWDAGAIVLAAGVNTNNTRTND